MSADKSKRMGARASAGLVNVVMLRLTARAAPQIWLLMTYETILTALADPTRRAVLDRLRAGPLPVGRIADGMSVSRPAVSQHLKVLRDAGLVSKTSEGTRNHYALVTGGAASLSSWLGALRSVSAVNAVVAGATREMMTRLTPSEAWTLFCDDLAIWWPVARVSLSAQSDGALPQVVVMNPVDGGTLREVLFDGSEGVWANVTYAERPARLDLDWRLGTSSGSAVSVRFEGDPKGTRVTLNHDAEGPEMTALWDAVMERFAAAANASLSNF